MSSLDPPNGEIGWEAGDRGVLFDAGDARNDTRYGANGDLILNLRWDVNGIFYLVVVMAVISRVLGNLYYVSHNAITMYAIILAASKLIIAFWLLYGAWLM